MITWHPDPGSPEDEICYFGNTIVGTVRRTQGIWFVSLFLKTGPVNRCVYEDKQEAKDQLEAVAKHVMLGGK